MKRSVEYMLILCAAIAATLASFTATAFAAGVAEPADGSLWDVLRPVYDAFHSGRYAYAGSMALVVVVALARKYGDQWPWIHTDRGAASLVFLASFGTTLSVRLASSSLTLSMAWDAFVLGVGAIGGYATIKKFVIEPLLLPLATKYPKLGALLSPLIWIFDSRAPDAPAETNAKTPEAS